MTWGPAPRRVTWGSAHCAGERLSRFWPVCTLGRQDPRPETGSLLKPQSLAPQGRHSRCLLRPSLDPGSPRTEALLREALLDLSPQRAPCPGAAVLLPSVSALCPPGQGGLWGSPSPEAPTPRPLPGAGRAPPPACSLPTRQLLVPRPLATPPQGPQAPGLSQRQVLLRTGPAGARGASTSLWATYEGVLVRRGPCTSPGSVSPVPTPSGPPGPNLAFRAASANRSPQGRAMPGGSARSQADPSKASAPWPSSAPPSRFPAP